MTANLYCGLTLTWNYDKRYFDVSMPDYIKKLHSSNHTGPSCPQKSPHNWDRPVYGAHIQYALEDTNLPLLLPLETTCVQQIVGTLLFYTRAIDNTMLVALNSITTEQSNATAKTA